MKNLVRGFLFGLIVMNPLLAMEHDFSATDVDDGGYAFGIGGLNISSSPHNVVGKKSSDERERSGSNDSGRGMSSSGKLIRQVSSHGMPRVSSNGMLPGDGNHSPTGRHTGAIGVVRSLDLESLIYERASVRDADELMSIYSNFNADDQHRLLVFPGIDKDGVSYQRKILLGSLEKGRVFVARLPNSGKIVAFLKLFVIDDENELRCILQDELRALKPGVDGEASSVMVGGAVLTECTPGDAASCELDPSFVYDFSRKPDYSSDLPVPIFKHKRENTYVYYGGAYTLLETGASGKDYRGLGINFRLEQAALEIISVDIQRTALFSGSKEIFYVYGVVEANATTTARLRAASIMIRVLLTNLKVKIIEPIRLSSFAFRAFKPSFYQEAVGEPLKLLPDQAANAGYGTLIGYRIRD